MFYTGQLFFAAYLADTCMHDVMHHGGSFQKSLWLKWCNAGLSPVHLTVFAVAEMGELYCFSKQTMCRAGACNTLGWSLLSCRIFEDSYSKVWHKSYTCCSCCSALGIMDLLRGCDRCGSCWLYMGTSHFQSVKRGVAAVLDRFCIA